MKDYLIGAVVVLVCCVGVQAGDVDGDGVDDSVDVCDNTPAGVAVDATGRPVGDIDGDCDNDLYDFSLYIEGFTGPLPPPPVVIETVVIGNPGNTSEWSGASHSGQGTDRLCGAVGYEYSIAKYEVTAGQYATFLNAVAATDTYWLYNMEMWTSDRGCKIKRSGVSGNYAYGVASDWANRPVNFISWADAARFCNWLHNGQPVGVQDLSTTEDGSYYLNGAMSEADLMAVSREPDATWVIPTEDEWYKAAYHKNDGFTGNYFDFATSSDVVPDNYVFSPDPGNTVNVYLGGYTIGAPYWRTVIGEFENSDSPYGTFDQSGNITEWTETAEGTTMRTTRGGAFGDGYGWAMAACRYAISPTFQGLGFGFRVGER